MPARQSRWKAQHVGCQKAVDNVKADLTDEIERLTHENQRLIGALRVTATVAILAQCPVCLAERTNGEWHADDCPLAQ
jgi:hypothetical protein